MDRKIDAIGIQPIDSNRFQIVEISLEDRRLSYLNFREIDRSRNESFDKTYFKKNAGRNALVFPLENSYIYELDLPGNISRRSAAKILKMNSEISLPVPMNGHYRYGLVTEESEEKLKYLQFLFSDHQVSFQQEMELGIVQTHPSAFFQGFSEIFDFPKDKISLLYYKGSKGVQIAWGMSGKIQGIRVIKKIGSDQQRDMLSQTFLACPNAEYFYSWCDHETRLELDRVFPDLKWIHLSDQELPVLLKGKEESLPAVCAAFAHALGYQNKCQQLAPEASNVLRNRILKKPTLLSFFLILFLSLIFEITSLIQIQKFRKENKFLSEQIEKTFYSVFPRTIPMVDPLKQFQEKISGGKSVAGTLLRPEEFIKILSILHNAKPEGIKIFRISLHAEQLKVEGTSLNLEALESWARVIQNKGFKNVKLDDVNRRAEESTFVFNLIIHLNDITKERKG